MSYQTIHTTIMRRVYYAFAVRLATHTVTLHVLALAVLGFVLAKLVFVARVYENLASREFGELLPATLRILMHADVLTLVVFAVAVFTALSLPVRTFVLRPAPLQFA
ncbi:MAG: hypothetical protein R3B69_03220 [Candidatus Paceibacterota bacterium]